MGSSINSSCGSDLGLVEFFDHDNNDLLDDDMIVKDAELCSIIFDHDRSFSHDESSPRITKVVTIETGIKLHNTLNKDNEDKNDNTLTQRRAFFPFKSIKFLGLLMAITSSLQYYFVISLDSDICSCRDIPTRRMVPVTNF